MMISVPKTLYHYCSFAAMLGIVQNCEIWASDARFMNDNRDFTYGIDILKNSSLSTDSDPSIKALFERSLCNLSSYDASVYISSFSASRDDNSQWSRYAHENGVALGFNRERLASIMYECFFDFGRVEYDADLQLERVNDASQRAFSVFRGIKLNDEDLSRICNAKTSALAARLALCKEPAFSSENEWRGSAFTLSGATRGKYRASPFGLVPYVSVQLIDPIKRQWEGVFDEIVIGPGRFREENTMSTRRFVASQKLYCEVVASKSALRF